ncbi:Lactoylglutathione lyase related protein (plasmid) [Deinococcus geothermalis DSM 11300]|uniref:Lactoylglutathione lyase related protein n=1 Tax=Deinococcus geothermalis (strain DSM 11300 / CIP 105573 / AG-3a) TaxID=319795 RepID=Q1J3T5_DEIGD|nr:glyoxalase/bleomycin resistance/dioxygenase family protein [Deinococcus geothermalis]ABF43849.1 Lactoylglutathione lyase related protein [Deinococcus geothermalis DSM 11300]
MKIQALTLQAGDLNAQRALYAEVLGFPVLFATVEAVTFQIGHTRLTFQQDGNFQGPYHFAFNVPENRFAQARAWLEDRVPLLADPAGETSFHSESWNADMVYFRDTDGNIAEFIARHTLPAAPGDSFGAADVLGVSELGLPVARVPEAVQDLQKRFGLPVYGKASETFTPLGDEEGLLIVVPVGRGWFPVGTPAQALPFELHAVTERGPFTLQEQP